MPELFVNSFGVCLAARPSRFPYFLPPYLCIRPFLNIPFITGIHLPHLLYTPTHPAAPPRRAPCAPVSPLRVMSHSLPVQSSRQLSQHPQIQTLALTPPALNHRHQSAHPVHDDLSSSSTYSLNLKFEAQSLYLKPRHCTQTHALLTPLTSLFHTFQPYSARFTHTRGPAIVFIPPSLFPASRSASSLTPSFHRYPPTKYPPPPEYSPPTIRWNRAPASKLT